MQKVPAISRIFDLKEFCNQRFPQKTAFCTVKHRKWSQVSFRQFSDEADNVSYALMKLGILKDDKIITITRNRAEFNFVDIGVLQTGAVHIPLYSTIDIVKLFAITQETSCKLIFCDSIQMLSKLKELQTKLKELKNVICFDKTEGENSYENFISIGKTNHDTEQLEKIKSSISPHDLASITYISGSTTEVKGVEHTHYHHIHNFVSISKSTCIKEDMNLLSILPLAHSYERSINYCSQFLGATTWYNHSFKSIEVDIKEIKPEVLFTVPLLMNRIFMMLTSRLQPKNSFKKMIFGYAIRFAKKYESHEIRGFNKWLKYYFDKTVYSSFRQQMGNNLEMLYCGGASLKQDLRRFFDNCGIPCYEGYGLTEAGPVVTHNNPKNKKASTVGKPIADTSIKIGVDGEIMVKSPSNFAKYFNQQSNNSSINDDGYLHTGDIGSIDNEGFLTISGVKKRIFKLSTGVYVDPLPIEAILDKIAGIKKSYIGGASSNFLTAVLIIDNDFITENVLALKIKEHSETKFQVNNKLSHYFSNLLKQFNEENKNYDSVSSFIPILEQDMQNSFLFVQTINRNHLHQWVTANKAQIIKIN